MYLISFSFNLRVETYMERRAERKVTATNKRNGKKMRDILKLYPKAKAEALIEKLTKKGLWYWDPDFPEDKEEIFYYVGEGVELKNQHITSEAVGLKVKSNDKEVAEALTADGAPLGKGAMPNVPVGTAEGSAAVLESIADTTVEQPTPTEKKKGKKRKGETTEAVPKTWLEPGTPANTITAIFVHRKKQRIHIAKIRNVKWIQHFFHSFLITHLSTCPGMLRKRWICACPKADKRVRMQLLWETWSIPETLQHILCSFPRKWKVSTRSCSLLSNKKWKILTSMRSSLGLSTKSCNGLKRPRQGLQSN